MVAVRWNWIYQEKQLRGYEDLILEERMDL